MISSLLGRVFQFLIAVVSVRVMTTVLSASEVGKVALITTLVNFCVLFLISPLGTFINRRLHSWHDAGRVRVYFVWYALYLLAVASLCAPLAVAAVYWGWLPLDVGWGVLGLVIWGSILFGTVHQTLIPSLNLLGRDVAFAVLSVLSSAAGLGLSAWLTQAGDQALATHWVAGAVMAQGLFSLVAACVFFRGRLLHWEPAVRPTRAMVSKAWQFAWPVSIAVACGWLHFQGYRFVLADAVGLAELGYFVAGYGIAASLFAALEQVLTTWFMPRFYRQVNQAGTAESASAWGRYASSVLPLSLLALVAVVSLSDALVHWMLGAAFQNTQTYVRWGALAEWTRVVAGIYVLVAHQHMRTRDLVVPHFIGAVVAFGMVSGVASFGVLSLVPVGLAIGNLLVIGVLRYTQGQAARLSPDAMGLLAQALALAAGVSAAGWVLQSLGGAQWGAASLTYAVLMALLWLGAGLFLLRRVMMREHVKEQA